VDRALWACGKHIKQLVKARGRGGQHLGDYASENTVLKLPKTPVQDLQHEWVHSITFGGKAKSFWWKIDDGYNIHITRAFNGANKIVNTKLISPAETERLNNYMAQNGWVPLANNVEKLRSGEEKHGIGRFLYEQLGWSTTDSQLAGHLGVIFSLSGVWEYNGKKKGIEFRQLSKEWRNLVKIVDLHSLVIRFKEKTGIEVIIIPEVLHKVSSMDAADAVVACITMGQAVNFQRENYRLVFLYRDLLGAYF
jgi:hypothetical protein